MIDEKKRNTLKVLAGSAAIVSVPSIASASCLNHTTHTASASQDEIIVPISQGAELTISLSVDPEPVISITNHSDNLIIVRNVYPGIIHAGAKTFDINSIFANSAAGIGAGTSRRFKINPTIATQAEVQYPRHLYRNKPQRIVTVTGQDRNGILANSTRSFYA